MSDYFYRFRSTAALLGQFEELERQEIYFSPPDHLNDPMEGFKNVVWQGDSIVWRNLLRHYLLCLTNAGFLAMVLGSDFTPDYCTTLVRQSDEDLPDAPIRNILSEIRADFFRHKATQTFVEILGRRNLAVKRAGLSAYLRLLQPLALRAMWTTFAAHQLIPTTAGLNTLPASITEDLGVMLESHAAAGRDAEAILTIGENMTTQIELIDDFNRDISDGREKWLFIARDFPKFYAVALEQLLFPDWCTACFVRDPTNAAMWGVYGDGHRGVCLQFRSQASVEGIHTLDLHGAVGLSSSGKGDTQTIYGYRAHTFEKVRYANDYPEINFFETLGTLSRTKLTGFWYAGEDGVRSPIGNRVLVENADWRAEYWMRHGIISTTKLPQWAHEEEYRLILSSSLASIDDIASRKLRYRFSDLAGIAFGTRTSHADKLAIMRIIERKALAEKRDYFGFYQASYSSRTGSFELLPLRLLKIQP